MDTVQIFKLKQEIQQLLKEKPELIPLQKKIDELMKNAGNQHNRCVLLQELMKEKVNELKEQLDNLQIELRKFYNVTENLKENINEKQ